jgi:hypothetical protein
MPSQAPAGPCVSGTQEGKIIAKGRIISAMIDFISLWGELGFGMLICYYLSK